MRNRILSTVVALVLGAFAVGAQQTPPAGGRGAGAGGRQGGPGGGAPQVPSVSKRPTGSELGTIRVAAQDENMVRLARGHHQRPQGNDLSEGGGRADGPSFMNLQCPALSR
jgi:hypothetical protein